MNYQQEYYLLNKEKIKQKVKNYRVNNKEKIKILNRIYNMNHKEENHNIQKKIREKINSIVIWHYSNGTYKCECCGFNEGKLFLQIDHINGNGNKHARQIKFRNLAYWLVKQKLPEGYQVLCGSCNHAKFRNNGVCPHQIMENIT